MRAPLAILAIFALLLAGCSVLPFAEETTITEAQRVPCPVVAVEFECEGEMYRADDFMDMTPSQIMEDWSREKRRSECLQLAVEAWEAAHSNCFGQEEGWLF